MSRYQQANQYQDANYGNGNGYNDGGYNGGYQDEPNGGYGDGGYGKYAGTPGAGGNECECRYFAICYLRIMRGGETRRLCEREKLSRHKDEAAMEAMRKGNTKARACCLPLFAGDCGLACLACGSYLLLHAAY